MIEIILWVWLGILVGFVGGVVLISLMSTGKIADLESEISDLRIQRGLLKEELMKLEVQGSKPSPRRYRNKKFKRSPNRGGNTGPPKR